MRTTVFFLASLGLLACGRSNLGEEPQPAAPTPPVQQREAPLFVFRGSPCPTPGVESDLKVSIQGDRLVLVQTQAQGECSGAGGEYLIGRDVNAPVDFFVGAHACYFHPAALRDTESYQCVGGGPCTRQRMFWGVARVSQTAALFSAPQGWCITSLTGSTGVTTDSIAEAWALYPSEASARAAFAELGR